MLALTLAATLLGQQPSTQPQTADWGTLGPVQNVWIDQSRGIWGVGRQFQDGPHKGKWRFTAKYQDDPTGFVAYLNQVRASYRLPPVAYDPTAADHAKENNKRQRIFGLGHHHTGGFAQNAATKPNINIVDAMDLWLNSTLHRAMMLAPTLRSAGYASDGTYATLNAVGYYAQTVYYGVRYPVSGRVLR